jgi:hypothetical protein
VNTLTRVLTKTKAKGKGFISFNGGFFYSTFASSCVVVLSVSRFVLPTKTTCLFAK